MEHRQDVVCVECGCIEDRESAIIVLAAAVDRSIGGHVLVWRLRPTCLFR